MSLIPTIYKRPGGWPLYWRAETSGVLALVVHIYLEHVLDPEKHRAPNQQEIELLRDYFVHHINAPCWLEIQDDEEMIAAIGALQEQAAKIAAVQDLRSYITAAMELGLDPL